MHTSPCASGPLHISGLQKMTLLDYPGRVACTAFLHGCNYRCPFCHNSGLLGGEAEQLMDENTFLAFLKKRRGLLDGVCISGGEPTLNPHLPALLESIQALGYAVKLDTNGSRPDVLASLMEKGLVQYVAMDVKNSPDRYAQTTGVQADLSAVTKSLRLLLCGDTPYELRTTVVKDFHDAQSIADMGRWLAGIAAPILPRALFLQPFVDRDSVLLPGLNAPSQQELEQYRQILRPYAQQVDIRGT